MSLLQMSFAGAAIILVTVLLRAAALHKLPKTAFLLLWGIALARLLIPYALPSALSVYSLWETLQPVAQAPLAVPVARVFTAGSGVSEAAAAFSPAHTPPEPSPLPWVWLAGSAVCAAFFAAAYLKCRAEFRAALPVENPFVTRWCTANALRRRLTVRQSDRVATPLTYGVFRPVILLPKGIDWNDEEALLYVLAHERVHIRRFDAVSKLLLTAAVCLHWWNPLVWSMYILANRDLEISCDESVILRSGGTRAAYAKALIRMEEKKSGFAPLSSGFSRNAMKERIIAIMKIKKNSALAVLTAAALVAGTGTVFATSATQPSECLIPGTAAIEAVQYADTIEEETVRRSAQMDAEWWTYEEYQEWLEKERIELQSMLGERGWTGGRGEFVWTQDVIDETIAMYEQILKAIQNGYLVSKTINGSEDVMLASGEIWKSDETPSTDEYKPFGIVLNKNDNALYYNGQKILYFEDGVDVGGGGWCSRYTYYREDGTASLRTVRQALENPDGSIDPFGPIVHVELLTAEETERQIEAYRAAGEQQTAAYASEDNFAETEELLRLYTPFGLKYRIDLVSGQLRMEYAGRQVHSISDTQAGLWIANNMRGTDLDSDAIDLEAVYENGEIAGLRESEVPHRIQHYTAVAIPGEADGEITEGTPLPDMFYKYAPYGISYEEKETADGMERSLYLNGRFVNSFADVNPSGGVFTFGSTRQREEGLSVRVVYENGTAVGVAEY